MYHCPGEEGDPDASSGYSPASWGQSMCSRLSVLPLLLPKGAAKVGPGPPVIEGTLRFPGGKPGLPQRQNEGAGSQVRE